MTDLLADQARSGASEPPTATRMVLDTSVLISDPDSITAFPDADTVIPLVVVEELDQHKSRMDDVGRAARAVIRAIEELRIANDGDIRQPVPLPNGGTLRIETNGLHLNEIREHGLDPTKNDNRILAASLGQAVPRPHGRRVERRRAAHQGGAARPRGDGAPPPPRSHRVRAPGRAGPRSRSRRPPIDALYAQHQRHRHRRARPARRRHRARAARRPLRRAAGRQPVGARAPRRRRARAAAARARSRGACARGRRSSSSPSTSCSTPRCASSPSTAWPAPARRSSRWPPASSR